MYLGIRWMSRDCCSEGLSILETLLGELLLCFSAVSLASLQSGQSTCFVTFPQSLAFLAVDATSQAMTLSTTRIATYAALPAPRRDPPAPAVNACGMMFFGFMGFTIVAFVMLV
ncbi:unnamed protein product, partial [Effrenium voratum]